MEGFYTISLESTHCDICNQDTGEELINCILNDRLQVVDTINTSQNAEPFKRAHRQCLDKWKSVVQTTLTSRCPSPKRSWKDKIKVFLNRNLDDNSVGDAWFQVDDKTSSSEKVENNDPPYQNISITNTNANRFLKNEEYRVERIDHGLSGCEKRARKLRIRSVDVEDEVPSSNSPDTSWTTERLKETHTDEIKRILSEIKRKIEETSTFLISELEEKDSLRQQADSLHATVAQLVELQRKKDIKTLSLDFEQRRHLVS